MSDPMKSRKKGDTPSRRSPFKREHLLMFGLEIMQSEMDSQHASTVTAVRCLFCMRLGRDSVELVDGRKRQQTQNVKYFSPPFRKDNFTAHVKSQHEEEFKKYSSLSMEEKKRFFDAKKRTQDPMHRYLNATQTALCIPMLKDIVEVIIGDMFFKPELDEEDEELEPITKTNAMKLFKQQPDGSYVAKVTNPALYDLVLKHTSVDLSFRQTSAVIAHHKDAFGNARLAGLNDHEVGKMVRMHVGANLQVLSDVLNDDEVWAFSLAGDGTTHFNTSFFNVRIHTCVRGVLFNVHLVCVLFFERHTTVNIFKMICKLLDHLCALWRVKLVSVSTDGENTMTGWLGGFVTLMVKEAVHEVLRVWCPLHQIDLVIKDATCKISGGSFSKIMHAFMVHLRQQANLQLEMGSKCPKDTNRWAHFQAQLDWLLKHRVRLMEWVVQRQHGSSPTVTYWIIAAAINPFAKFCCATLIVLQHRNIALVQNLFLMVDIQHDVDNEEMRRENREEGRFFEVGRWWVTIDAVLVHVKDQGTWVKEMYLSLDEDAQFDMLREIGLYSLRLVSGLSIVQAERDYRNNAAAYLAPPVFPQQLINMRTSKFIEEVLDPRREMMIAAWGQRCVDLIEEEHRALLEMIRSSATLKAVIEGHTFKTMFNIAWNDLPAQLALHHLRTFCGGLASAFANTTSVESDFSILKCEKDAYRMCVMALSVEGIFQTKQLVTIREMLGLITPSVALPPPNQQ